LLYNNFFVKVGQKLFLDYHQNKAALFILKLGSTNDYKGKFLMGRINFVIGGRENLFKSVKHYSESIDLIGEQNIKDFTLLSQSYYGRGLAYGFLGGIYLIRAEEDFKKYIELEDKLEFETGKRSYGSWAGYNDLAWILYLQGDFKGGETVAKKGLKISQNNPWLLNMLGILQIEQNNCTGAILNLNSAKKFLSKITPNMWGEAYSGDSPLKYLNGKKNMINTINYNIKLCNGFDLK
jgi:tetratricopeptide (TPR) repeat protein